MDIYAEGAEVLWGRPATGMGLGDKALEAGLNARILTEELVLLYQTVKQAVKEAPTRYPRAYLEALNGFIKSWQDFVVFVSGQNISWYDFPGKVFATVSVRWYGAEIFNRVVEYRKKFNQLWILASKVEGKDATAVKPPEPPARVSTSPLVDAATTMVKGAAIIGALGLGAYLLINFLGKPKSAAAPDVVIKD